MLVCRLGVVVWLNMFWRQWNSFWPLGLQSLTILAIYVAFCNMITSHYELNFLFFGITSRLYLCFLLRLCMLVCCLSIVWSIVIRSTLWSQMACPILGVPLPIGKCWECEIASCVKIFWAHIMILRFSAFFASALYPPCVDLVGIIVNY